MRYLKMLICSAAFATASTALAQEATTRPTSTHPASATTAADATRAINLQQVTVSGVQPGPGLWKVSKGDHVLWVLGTLNPLPKKMQWQAREVQDDLAQAQEVLATPSIYLHADIGFFARLALLPSLIGVRNNPDGKKLQDLMPAAEYARWLALKDKYIGRDHGIEKQRPIFAAITLYYAAIKQAELADDVIDPAIQDMLKQRRLKSTPVQLTIEVPNPRELVRNFKHEPIEDLDCFGKTLDHLESDVSLMRERANAWAMGDLDHLRELPMSNQRDVCIAAITESGVAQKLGVTDLTGKVKATWVDAASKALDTNRTSFAFLPVRRLLGAGNYLATLRERGYQVQLPEGLTDDAVDSPAPAVEDPQRRATRSLCSTAQSRCHSAPAARRRTVRAIARRWWRWRSAR